jgi:hypothetical protein
MRCAVEHKVWGQCALQEGHEGNHTPSRVQLQAHRCHAKGCTIKVKPEMLMCSKHWKMVPKNIQKEVWNHYRPGQCRDKNPSKEWMKAADEAINSVATKEAIAAL